MRLFFKIWFLSLSLFSVASSQALSLKTAVECNNDRPLMVSELSFSFPFEHVSGINVLNGDSASAVITFVDNWLPLLHIITTDETKLSGGINERGGFKKLGVNNIVELFHKVKSDTEPNSYLEKVKKALALENSDNVHISDSGGNHVIFHRNAYENGADAIYIIRKNDSRIMMLVADVNEQQTERLLAHICI